MTDGYWDGHVCVADCTSNPADCRLTSRECTGRCMRYWEYDDVTRNDERAREEGQKSEEEGVTTHLARNEWTLDGISRGGTIDCNLVEEVGYSLDV